MGKLRMEAKVKPFLNEQEYQQYLRILKEAQSAATDNHVYWDLEKNENASHIRKAFLHIAEKESIPVTIRKGRGSRTLAFSFRENGRTATTRMSATECRNRIMNALSSSSEPLQKSEIINSTGISPSTWNIRIKELMKEGKVIRTGDRRDTKYTTIVNR